MSLAATLDLPVEILKCVPEKWLKVRQDGHVELPGYCQRNNMDGMELRKQRAAERRAKDRTRQRRHRSKKRNADVTRDTPVTPPVTSRVTPPLRHADVTRPTAITSWMWSSTITALPLLVYGHVGPHLRFLKPNAAPCA